MTSPPIVELTAVAAALEEGEGFFVYAPTIQAAAKAQGRDIVIQPAWGLTDGDTITQDGGDYFYVLPTGVHPPPGVS